jgi:outer membrane protein TolC
LSGVVNIGDLVNPAYQALNQLTGSSRFPTALNATLPFAQETWIRLRQPIFNPAITANHQASASLRDARDADLATTARTLAAQVQLAYLGMASAGRAVELFRATLPRAEETQRVTERLLAAGKVTPDAVLRARAERAELAQQLAEAVQRRDAAQRALNMILNRPLDGAVVTDSTVVDSTLDAPPTISLDDALRAALARREELHAADAGIRASDASRRAVAASFLPTVAAAVDYGYQGNDYQFDRRRDSYVVSLVAQWNLFNGGQDAARRDEAALVAERARLGRRDLARGVDLEVRQAHDAMLVAYSAIATANERVAAAKRAYELVERRYVEGLASPLDVIDARGAYTRAGLNLILTRQAYASRCVELERAAALRDVAHDLSAAAERSADSRR